MSVKFPSHSQLIFFACALPLLFASCAKEPEYVDAGPQAELKRCTMLSDKKKYEESVKCLEILKSRYPKSAEGREAELRIGDTQFERKEYLVAAEAYNAFLQLYPRSPRADYAHYRAGLSYFRALPKRIDRDQENLDDATEHLRAVVERYPQSAYRSLSARFLKEARLRAAKRHFYVGRFYFRTGEYLAAVPRLREVATDYIDSGLAPKALYLMVLANLELGDIAGAKDAFSILAVEYPKSPWSDKAQRHLLAEAQPRRK